MMVDFETSHSSWSPLPFTVPVANLTTYTATVRPLLVMPVGMLLGDRHGCYYVIGMNVIERSPCVGIRKR